MNNKFEISSILILFQIFCFFMNMIINIPNNIYSSLVFPHICIIIVMYMTNCNISFKTISILTIIKLIILIYLLKKSKLNLKNYTTGLLLIGIYLLTSNLTKIYLCDIKTTELINTFLISTGIYYFIYNRYNLL